MMPPDRTGNFRLAGPGELWVVGEFDAACQEAFDSKRCRLLRWHRSKDILTGLDRVATLSTLTEFDFITHLTLHKWTPPAQLQSLEVSFRGRAKGCVIDLTSAQSLRRLLVENGHVSGLGHLPVLQELTLDRASVEDSTLPLPVRTLHLSGLTDVDLRRWLSPTLQQLRLDDCTVHGWDALASAHALEGLYLHNRSTDLTPVPDVPPLPNLRVLSLRGVASSGRIPATHYPLLEYGGIFGVVPHVPEGWHRRDDGSVTNGGTVGVPPRPDVSQPSPD